MNATSRCVSRWFASRYFRFEAGHPRPSPNRKWWLPRIKQSLGQIRSIVNGKSRRRAGNDKGDGRHREAKPQSEASITLPSAPKGMLWLAGREVESVHYRNFVSGASRDRTGDLLLAKQALSQLSYGPLAVESSRPLVNRVGVRLTLAPPTPPGMRVRTGRFAQHSRKRRRGR